MTSFCNIFKPIDSPTGNFLLFSQYAEDLSRSVVDPNYKVRPSRFVCMDLDSDSLTGIDSLNQEYSVNEYEVGNSYIPQFFQNAFEESISRYKYDDEDKSFTPNIFATCFWNLLAHATSFSPGMITIPNLNTKIKYSGDIDLVGWEDGFADVILNISSGSEPQSFKWWMDPINPVWTVFDNASGMKSVTFPDFIDGWKLSDGIPLNGYIEPVLHNIGYGVYDSSYTGYKFNSNNESVFNRIFKSTTSEDVSFTFNTIIILYDIEDSEGGSIYTDIPMGIYFTGDVESDIINNPVTIYSSSADAYGAGTGWSLRISTRFSPTPWGLVPERVALESGDALYQTISAQMAAVAELIKAERDGLKNVTTVSQNFADFVNEFKNTRQINVPYIVDGYWFVNGGNTGYPANALGVEEANETEIMSVFNS